jgi:hypothetical protein
MPEDDVMKQTIEAALRDAELTARLGNGNQLNAAGEQARDSLLATIRRDIEATNSAEGVAR